MLRRENVEVPCGSNGLQAADVRLARTSGFDRYDISILVVPLAFRLEMILEAHLVCRLLLEKKKEMITLNDLNQLCNNLERVRSNSPRIEYDGVSTFGRSDG